MAAIYHGICAELLKSVPYGFVLMANETIVCMSLGILRLQSLLWKILTTLILLLVFNLNFVCDLIDD